MLIVTFAVPAGVSSLFVLILCPWFGLLFVSVIGMDPLAQEDAELNFVGNPGTVLSDRLILILLGPGIAG